MQRGTVRPNVRASSHEGTLMELRAERIRRLQEMPLFGGIREDMLDFLLVRCRAAEVLQGGFFFREGERAESMFVLEAGSVAVRRKGDGGEVVLCTLGPGACFGEMALIDLSPRSATVEALVDCRALEIFATSLYELYERDLEQFTLIQMNIARELSRRLRVADERAVSR